MPCMCGDPYCPSCGPAQGFDPEMEKFLDHLVDTFPLLENDLTNNEHLIDHLLDIFQSGYNANHGDPAQREARKALLLYVLQAGFDRAQEDREEAEALYAEHQQNLKRIRSNQRGLSGRLPDDDI